MDGYKDIINPPLGQPIGQSNEQLNGHPRTSLKMCRRKSVGLICFVSCCFCFAF